jgi:ferredoxin
MPKAKVTFADIGVTITVPAGARLIEMSEQAGAGLVYGYRESEYGDCPTRIIAGGKHHLADSSVLEDETLKNWLAPGDRGLACQARALGGEIVVEPG